MGSISSITDQLVTASEHFVISNMTNAMEKDGQQHFSLFMLANMRLHELGEQLAVVSPRFVNTPVTAAVIGIGLVASLAQPLAKELVKLKSKANDCRDRCLTAAATVLTVAGELSKRLLNHTDKILNVACCVAYVAMIALGFNVAGTIGLASILLIAIKRHNYLPVAIDRYLDHVTVLAALFATITHPASIGFRLLQTLTLLENVYHLGVSHEHTRHYLPTWFREPLPQKHLFTKFKDEELKRELDAKPDEALPLKINPTYIYADEVGEILPADFDKELENQTADALFDQLDKQIAEEGVKINGEGLAKIRMCAVTGRVGDQLPSDVELFQKMMKALVKSICQDKPNFEVRIKELIALSDACIEGWTRDVTAMLNPKSKDIRWAVHHHLSKMRSNIVKELIGMSDKTKNASCFKRILMSVLGGSNNVHFNNNIQLGVRHRFRTYEGEFHRRLHPHSFIGAIFTRFLTPSNAAAGVGDGLYVNWNTLAPMNFRPLFRELDRHFDNPNVLIDAVYEAIAPQVVKGKDGKFEVRREIHFDAVTTWASGISDRLGLDESALIKSDGTSPPILTREGVKILLMEMGILQAAK